MSQWVRSNAVRFIIQIEHIQFVWALRRESTKVHQLSGGWPLAALHRTAFRSQQCKAPFSLAQYLTSMPESPCTLNASGSDAIDQASQLKGETRTYLWSNLCHPPALVLEQDVKEKHTAAEPDIVLSLEVRCWHHCMCHLAMRCAVLQWRV